MVETYYVITMYDVHGCVTSILVQIGCPKDQQPFQGKVMTVELAVIEAE